MADLKKLTPLPFWKGKFIGLDVGKVEGIRLKILQISRMGCDDEIAADPVLVPKIAKILETQLGRAVSAEIAGLLIPVAEEGCWQALHTGRRPRTPGSRCRDLC